MNANGGKPNNSFISSLLRQSFSDLRSKIQKLPSEPVRILENELRIWMVGHATVLINLYGTTILTDPVLVHAIPYPRRLVASAYTAEELPPLDYVVISHAHLDHLNKPTLRQLVSKTGVLILPRNCRGLVAKMNFRQVVELDWEETFTDNNFTARSFRAMHWGKRVPWETIDRGYNGYLFQKNGHAVFFGGDTGYGEFFKNIGTNYHTDVALLPIGAYQPAAFRRHHMDPDDALQAAEDLKAGHLIPIHWGNFRLSLEHLAEPPERFLARVRELGIESQAHLLHNGQSFLLPMN